eukprot:3941407-Rhodomonas_salina.1
MRHFGLSKTCDSDGSPPTRSLGASSLPGSRDRICWTSARLLSQNAGLDACWNRGMLLAWSTTTQQKMTASKESASERNLGGDEGVEEREPNIHGFFVVAALGAPPTQLHCQPRRCLNCPPNPPQRSGHPSPQARRQCNRCYIAIVVGGIVVVGIGIVRQTRFS